MSPIRLPGRDESVLSADDVNGLAFNAKVPESTFTYLVGASVPGFSKYSGHVGTAGGGLYSTEMQVEEVLGRHAVSFTKKVQLTMEMLPSGEPGRYVTPHPEGGSKLPLIWRFDPSTGETLLEQDDPDEAISEIVEGLDEVHADQLDFSSPRPLGTELDRQFVVVELDNGHPVRMRWELRYTGVDDNYDA